MSSILKALQKLEKDKSTRKTREPDISTAIKMSGIRTREYPAWLIPFVVVTVAAVSILVTFSIMGGFSRHSGVQTASQPVLSPHTTSSNLPQSEPASSRVESPFRQEQPPDFNPSVERKSAQHAAPELPIPPVSPAPTKTVHPEPAVHNPTQDAKPAVPEEKPQKLILTISGIAWQSDSASRIAVVNGSSVSEGSNLGGAKVEQIFPDRVRFLKDGEAFEIFLNQEAQR